MTEAFGAGPGEVVAYKATISLGALKNTVALTRVSADRELSARLEPMTMTALEV